MESQKKDTELHLFKKIVLEKARVATCEFTTPINVGSSGISVEIALN